MKELKLKFNCPVCHCWPIQIVWDPKLIPNGPTKTMIIKVIEDMFQHYRNSHPSRPIPIFSIDSFIPTSILQRVKNQEETK